MLQYVQNRSFSYARNMLYNFRAFYLAQLHGKPEECLQVELEDVLNYRSGLSLETEWQLGYVRTLLDSMDNSGFGVASLEALQYLRGARFRRNVRGTAIRTRDPETGAFEDTELLYIQSCLNDCYADGRITLYQFAVAWLLIAYGSRPCQIAALKECDLVVSNGSDGKAYSLRIPRAKQIGQSERGEFKLRHCSKPIGQLIEEVIDWNSREFQGINLEKEKWPLFFADRRERFSVDHHISAERVYYIFNDVISRISNLKTNAKRFRSTIAQRAVDDGKDKYTVAELLDHSSTQSVYPYFDASPKIVARLDRALAMELAPLAQAFSGAVVHNENDAVRGGDRSSRIYDRTLQDNVSAALGNCGQTGLCELSAPYACYTCRRFQPWIDGPHDEFMEKLIADRQRMVDNGYSPRIFEIRDRTILAVAQVIQYCDGKLDVPLESLK
ncbi:site-specific integrase [Tardiphaga sp. P9-11]|nr:site-specific integrase [Tardiphaga sp. P9-11]